MFFIIILPKKKSTKYSYIQKKLIYSKNIQVEENENNARINEKKKKNKEAKKKYTQALGELKCIYTKKK